MKSFNLSAIAIKNQPLVRFLIIASFIIGTYCYFHLSQKEDPEFNFKVMIVTVYWPGATSIQVEQQILQRLEQHLKEIPKVNKLYGYGKPGEAQFYIELDEGINKQEIQKSWYQVRKKIADIRHLLPDEIIGPYFNDEFGDVYGSIYALVGDGFNFAELKSYAEDIRRELLHIPEVGKVLIIGDQQQKIYIEFSQSKIASLGINPQIIIDTIRKQNTLQSAGIVRTKTNEITVRLSGAFDSLESMRNINIRANENSFRLGDIAEVYRGYQDPPTFKIHFNGKEAIALIISMKENRDVLVLGDSLSKVFQNIQKNLPVGIEIYQVSNQPQVVKHAVEGFIHSLFEAIIIVLIVSFFSLGLRAGTVVAISIPLVLSITFIFMYLFNIDLQRVSLGALIISIGLLVDDAMITTEMMMRKLEEGFNAIKAVTFAYISTAFPMLTGTLITVAGFLPIGLAKSDTGEYTFSILSVVGISLIVSWFVAVFFTPYIGYILLKKNKSHPHEAEQPRIYKFVHQSVKFCIDHRKMTVCMTFLMFLLSIFSFQFVNKQFFPASERPELLVNMTLPEGSPFSLMEKEVNRLEKILATDTRIINYTTYIGGNSPRFYLALNIDQNRTNFSETVLMTKGGKTREKVLNDLNQLLEKDFPMVTPQVTRLENGPSVGYPIQFRITGKNPKILFDFASQITSIIKNNPYTYGVNSDWGKIFNQVLLVDNDKVRALGLSGSDISANLNLVLSGYLITKYREETELIDMEVRGQTLERSNLSNLKNINIYSPSGKYIPLDQLVYFTNNVEENKIWERDGSLAITISANVVGNIEPLDIALKLNNEIDLVRKKLPPGYQISIEGVAKSSANAQDSIIAVLPLSIFIMLFLLMLQLKSFQRVIIVFLTAPLGLIGVTLTLLIFRFPFGFVAMLGLIALMGMIMRNSVILIDQIEKNITQGTPAYEAIIKATVERFRPIMLTALATILAMIPLLGSIFWGAMAATIMGGLLAATLLTLVFLPALYAWWFKIKRNDMT